MIFDKFNNKCSSSNLLHKIDKISWFLKYWAKLTVFCFLNFVTINQKNQGYFINENGPCKKLLFQTFFCIIVLNLIFSIFKVMYVLNAILTCIPQHNITQVFFLANFPEIVHPILHKKVQLEVIRSNFKFLSPGSQKSLSLPRKRRYLPIFVLFMLD